MSWWGIWWGVVVGFLLFWAIEAVAHLPGYVAPTTSGKGVQIRVEDCNALGYVVLTPLGYRDAYQCKLDDMLFPSSGVRQKGACSIETKSKRETLWLCADGSYILKRRHLHT